MKIMISMKVWKKGHAESGRCFPPIGAPLLSAYELGDVEKSFSLLVEIEPRRCRIRVWHGLAHFLGKSVTGRPLSATSLLARMQSICFLALMHHEANPYGEDDRDEVGRRTHRSLAYDKRKRDYCNRDALHSVCLAQCSLPHSLGGFPHHCRHMI